MTRINVVPVSELTDNFILAEYFELPRVFVFARNHYDKGRTPAELNIPNEYRLGEGHVRFFYDKMLYLCTRFYQLGIEGLNRNLNLIQDPNTIDCLLPPMVHPQWWHDYKPTPEAIQLNHNRLQIRRRYDGGNYEAASWQVSEAGP